MLVWSMRLFHFLWLNLCALCVVLPYTSSTSALVPLSVTNEVTSVYKPCQMSWHLKHIRMIAVYELTNNTNCETNQLWVSVCMLVLFSVSYYPFIASCSEVWHSPKLYPAWMHLTKWNSIGNSGILDFTIGLLWLPSLELSTNFSTLLLVEGEG